MISSQTQSILKPTVPEKPKNIQLIKKKLEDIKSANVYPSSEIALRNSVLRKSNKLKNNPVIILTLCMQIHKLMQFSNNFSFEDFLKKFQLMTL